MILNKKPNDESVRTTDPATPVCISPHVWFRATLCGPCRPRSCWQKSSRIKKIKLQVRWSQRMCVVWNSDQPKCVQSGVWVRADIIEVARWVREICQTRKCVVERRHCEQKSIQISFFQFFFHHLRADLCIFAHPNRLFRVYFSFHPVFSSSPNLFFMRIHCNHVDPAKFIFFDQWFQNIDPRFVSEFSSDKKYFHAHFKNTK